MNILFIHGFGREQQENFFSKRIRQFINKYKINGHLNNFFWDSQTISLQDLGPQFSRAKRNAEKEFTNFSDTIRSLESKKSNYYIIAHSLGAYLVTNFLVNTNISSKRCAGIFFLGAAVKNSISIKTSFLTATQKIINYYSPKYDLVLRSLYRNKTDFHAGGEIGFTDDRFLNYRCAATHFYKPGIMHADWTQMIMPIMELIMYNENAPILGSLKINWRMWVGQGHDWWNNVLYFTNYYFENRSQCIFIQQHKVEGHYRLVSCIQSNTTRYREAHSNYLFPLLQKLNLRITSDQWPLYV